jgi:hypothetical protein
MYLEGKYEQKLALSGQKRTNDELILMLGAEF